MAEGTAASLVRGSLFRTLELVTVVGASFVVTPALVGALGDRVYGFWSLVGAFIGYYGMLDFGLAQAAARYLAQSLGRGDQAELERVAATAFALFVAIGAAVLALTGACWFVTPHMVRDPAEADLFRRLLVVMGAAAALGFPAKVYQGMLQADIRYDAISAINIARALAANGAIYWAARTGRGVMAVAWITFAANVLQYAATYGAARQVFPRFRMRLRSAERSRVGLMFSHGWYTVICQVGDLMRFRLDSAIVAAFLGAALVTPYTVGGRLVEGYAQLVFGVVGMMLPVFSRFEGRGDFDAVRGALIKSTRLGTILSTFVGMSILFYGRAFISRWMGADFRGAFGVAAILTAAFMIDLPQSPGIQLLYGLSLHRVYAVIGVFEGVANVVLSVLLVKRFGLYGVALGTLLEFFVFKLVVIPPYICRPIGLPLKDYLWDAIARPFAATAAPLALFFLAASRFVAPNYGALAACVAVQTALFAPIAYFLILAPDERAAFSGVLGGFLCRLAPS